MKRKNEIVGFDSDHKSGKSITNDILVPDSVTGKSEQYIDNTVDFSKPSPSDAISKSIAENPLPSPYFDRIKLNEDRRNILKTMPVTDQNGRLKSGLKGFLEGLSEAFHPKFGVARDWGEFGAKLAHAGGKGIGGAINPAWDEEADRDRQVAEIDSENERLTQIGQKDWQMRMQSANFGFNQQKEENRQINEKTRQENRNRELDLREARQNFQKLNSEQKTVLQTIMKRGFYKEGLDKAEDARISELGIILPDFDSRKPITKEQNGQFFQYDHDSQDWKSAQGMPIDESEVPIEFSIGGQRMKLRPRDIAGIEAAKERQSTQQNFTASENEKSRNFQERMKNISNENDAVNQVNKAIQDGQKRISDGDLSREQYKQGIQTLINMFPENIKNTLLQRFSKEVN